MPRTWEDLNPIMEPRTLREMLAEAKDTSEVMVDLAYAALFFDDADMADEVDELEAETSRERD